MTSLVQLHACLVQLYACRLQANFFELISAQVTRMHLQLHYRLGMGPIATLQQFR